MNNKLEVKILGFALALAMVFTAAPAAQAQTATTQSLLALIAQLQAQISLLQIQIAGGTTTTGFVFTRDLTIGSTGSDVVVLQNFLIEKGFLVIPVGVNKGYFGPLTQAALAQFQAANNISPTAGYFGPITRARINAMIRVPSPIPPIPITPGDLQGGSGSVDTYSLLSGLQNEEVGEDSNDSEVAGLELEVDNGSDIRLTAVRLVFDEGTAGSDFEDYADEVSLWLDGEEVARVDADEFTDNNNWTKTVSLDSSAIIRAGRTGELVVAISGAGNLDSNDTGDSWTVDFRQVRFVDANGDSTSEDPGTDVRTFTFETFAAATNAELRIAEDDDEVNDPRIVDVHTSDDTDNVPVLSFTMQARGDSDLEIRKLSASTTVTGATNVDGVVKEITLWIEGDEIASGDCMQDSDCSSVGTTEGFLFDDVDYTIRAGNTVNAEIRVSFFGLTGSGDLDEGDTIQVVIDEPSTDDTAGWDVRDETNTRLGDADLTGVATGGAHSLSDVGLGIEHLDSNAVKTTGSIAGDPDSVHFTIKFRVTNDGDDAIYVDGDTGANGRSPTNADNAFNWATTTDSTTGTTTGSFGYSTAILSPEDGYGSNDTVTSGDKRLYVAAGDSREFTFNVTINAGGDNVAAGVMFTGFDWDTVSQDDMSNFYNFNLGEFTTDTVTGLDIAGN